MDPSEELTQVVSAEWQVWIAENLLRGEAEDEILRELENEGISKGDARSALKAVTESPIYHAARAVQTRALRGEMILDLERKRTRTLRIESRDELAPGEFHRRYRAANRPVLLPNFCREWPAFKRWTMSFLQAHYGSCTVQAMFSRDEDPDYDRNHANLTQETTLGEVIERIEREPESNDFYVVARDGVLRSPDFQALHDDIRPPDGFFTASVPSATALWLGPAGTITPLHHDQSDILFSQIVGRKRVRLIAPCERDLLSHADGLYGPSLDAFEEGPLAKVKVHDLVLNPGDTLFIPFGWWHHLTALDPSISIAINAFKDAHNPWYSPGGIKGT